MADAIVVGAGICGAAAAHFLARRGAEVLVLDRAGIALETSRHGEGNVLLCDKLPGPERELTIHGRRLWVQLGERFAEGRVTRKGSLLLSSPGEHPGDATIDGGPAMEPVPAVDAAHAGALEPALAAGVNAVLDPDDLQVDPPGMARALLAGIEVRAGVTVLTADVGRVTLDTGERLAAEHVLVAAGPWSGTLTGLPVQPRKGQLVALAAPSGLIAHKLIEAAYIASVADDDAGLSIATVVEQTLDGDELLVGSSRARVGFDPVVDERVTAAMIARAARFVPRVAELPVTRAWCGFRPWLPDHLPAIGELPTGVWTSTGHEGSGVCLGPISGLLLAQLICREPTVVDPSPFDPRRFQR
ncbi:MAG TPA: FAD-binding oxidoreductase [Solirubrobacteraceae bacterium]|nr:FAD-binding oxidoreductase [Solirubrobacteraceae bacterium]